MVSSADNCLLHVLNLARLHTISLCMSLKPIRALTLTQTVLLLTKVKKFPEGYLLPEHIPVPKQDVDDHRDGGRVRLYCHGRKADLIICVNCKHTKTEENMLMWYLEGPLKLK